jgi:hypothetical protein
LSFDELFYKSLVIRQVFIEEVAVSGMTDKLYARFRVPDLNRQARSRSSRRRLGSQVFDYWKDPNGFTMEHFTDGDLFNASSGSEKWPVDVALGSH